MSRRMPDKIWDDLADIACEQYYPISYDGDLENALAVRIENRDMSEADPDWRFDGQWVHIDVAPTVKGVAFAYHPKGVTQCLKNSEVVVCSRLGKSPVPLVRIMGRYDGHLCTIDCHLEYIDLESLQADS